MNHDISSGAAPRAHRLGLRAVLIGLALACAPCLQARVWGINGHPNYQEYKAWDPPSVAKQLDYVKQLGCKYYRCGFSVSSANNDPSILANLVPPAEARGIQIVPILDQDLAPSAGYQANYNVNYARGKKWADYALAMNALNANHTITHWELGNETGGGGVGTLFNVSGDGSLESHWSDKIPNATASMAGAINGLYWGIKNAYSAKGKTTQCLFGDVWRSFGYLQRIYHANGNFLPCDILAWHWYTPSFGAFTAPIVANNPATSPAAYLQAWNKDIWMTEVGRTTKPNGFDVGGSCNWYAYPLSNQSWPDQANELTTELNNLLTVERVKAVFVYSLYDEPITMSELPIPNEQPGDREKLLASQAYYGLINYAGYLKTAFGTYKDYITAHP